MRIDKIHDECNWHEFKHIYFFFLTIFKHIFKQILFITELFMKLQMIKAMPKNIILDTMLIFVRFV